MLKQQFGQLPLKFGFRDGNRGTHTSRTMMLAELRSLLLSLPASTAKSDYWTAIIEENILGKKTTATRRLSAQRLSELYALDPNVLLFRILRQLWEIDENGRRLLACLCANARDPLLRMTSEAVLPIAEGELVTTASIAEAVAKTTGERFNPATCQKIARNAASSWTQSGHLVGHSNKVRGKAKATPAAAAYALLLGFLCGMRGDILFDTYWTRLLDVSASQVDLLAFEASRRGWIDYKHIGAVAEIAFTGLLTTADLEAIRGQD